MPVQILMVSGSLRAQSTNTAVLETARAVAPPGVTGAVYDGMGGLPHFNPDDDREGDPVDPAVAELRAQIAAADALLLCTPEYAGALPGALKNLLEWTVGDAGTYMQQWTGCVAGALTRTEFEQTLADAGLTEIEINETHRVHEHASSAIIRARKPA